MKKGFGKFLLPVLCTLSACSRTITPEVGPEVPYVVSFMAADGSASKSVINPDGISVSWEDSDEVALWAFDASSSPVLDAQRFNIYGCDGAWARFTSALDSPMAAGTYKYVAAYPYPYSVSGTRASFFIPVLQDGKFSSGADIMLSAPVEGEALVSGSDNLLSIRMKHLLHVLKFYLPAGSNGLNGERVSRIVVEMPSEVAGIFVKDILDMESAAELQDGSRIVEILPENMTGSSTERDYAYAGIFPGAFDDGDVMKVRLYSENFWTELDAIPLDGRNMVAGHATPVMLKIGSVNQKLSLRFRIASNQLGEEIRKVTVTAPEGYDFGDGNVFVHDAGADIVTGDYVSAEFASESAFRAFGGASLDVTLESEHVIYRSKVQIPSLEGLSCHVCDIDIPSLLAEDFSSVETFTSNDNYGNNNTGSKNAVSFLDGWTGGRIGAQAGKCVRLGAFRKVSLLSNSENYARLDSAPLLEIKSPVDLEVSFDYGAAYQGSSATQEISVGYVTAATAFKSGDATGVFDSDNKFESAENTGSYDNTPNHVTLVIAAVPAGANNRIVWRNVPKSFSSILSAYSQTWLYVDNVNVKVKK